MAEAECELDREYRVLRQTLGIHAMLRDRYAWRALVLDIALLVCAVVFCATTFVPDTALGQAGLTSGVVRFILGTASVAAFLASIVALRVDWKGMSARHADAVFRLSEVLALFRNTWRDEGGWPERRRAELQRNYWGATNSVIGLPTGPAFDRLKAQYLKSVELSKMISAHPGCPVTALRVLLAWRALRRAVSADGGNLKGQDDGNTPDTDGPPEDG